MAQIGKIKSNQVMFENSDFLCFVNLVQMIGGPKMWGIARRGSVVELLFA